MTPHPVQFQAAPSRMSRVHVGVRLAAIVVLSSVACSSGYWLLYLAVPAFAALLIARDGPEGYLERDAPASIRVLQWLADAYAYLWLLTDAVPSAQVRPAPRLTIELGGKPTVGAALWRLVTSLPALLLLIVVSIVAAVLWIVGAISILATERVPSAITDFVAMKLRYQFRLVAYHLSLVDVYPVVADAPQPHAPPTGTA